MSWIKIDVDLPAHPKLIQLADFLSVSRGEALGLLVSWFSWVRKYRPTGEVPDAQFDLPGSSPEISRKFREGVEKTGFLRDGWVNGWSELGGSEITEFAKREPSKFRKMVDFYGIKPYGEIPGKKRGKNGLEEKRREEKRRDLDQDPSALASPPQAPETVPPSKPKVKPASRETYPADFEQFWAAYPASRRVNKKAALAQWRKEVPPLPAVLTALGWQVRSKSWLEEEGRFVPWPERYIKQRRWEQPQPEGSARDGEDRKREFNKILASFK